MTLFTRKDGQYMELSKDQLRKLRRTSEVIALQITAKHLAARTRALAAWLLQVNKASIAQDGVLKLTPADLVVTRLPNVEQLLMLADEVCKREEALHRC